MQLAWEWTFLMSRSVTVCIQFDVLDNTDILLQRLGRASRNLLSDYEETASEASQIGDDDDVDLE
jgi:hypothetical protein